MKRNILVLSHTGGTGGGERVLLDAISTLASCEKYNIYVAYPVDADSGFKKALETIDIAGSHSFRYRVARNTTPLSTTEYRIRYLIRVAASRALCPKT